MTEMNGIERISNILKRQPVDRIGLYEGFWGDTHKAYVEGGFMRPDESFETHFGLDLGGSWALNMIADIDFENKLVGEDEDTITLLDGNGATLRKHKKHDTTPEHIAYTVKDSGDWAAYKELIAKHDMRRVYFEGYREEKALCAREGRFFTWRGVNVFESMHPLCGHENLLAGMALEPEWVLDMANTYADLIIATQEELFAKEGKPDGIFYYEDMGFKERPFMSPAMYEELIFPSHKRTVDFAKSMGLPVLMHSCGYIRPLLPKMVEAGIDCLQVIEVKAGMDLLEIHKTFGDRLSLMGGIDVRKLYTNDRAVIDAELEAKIPIVKQGFGYVAHSDHSIPATVHYDTVRYYFDRALELGRYDG